MRSRKERLGADALRITVLHRIPAAHAPEAPIEALLQAGLAREVTLASVLIDQA